MNRHEIPVITKHLAAPLSAFLLLAACSTDDSAALTTDGGADASPFVLTVSEEPWGEDAVSITRDGETYNYLETNHFGLFCTEFNLENQEVTCTSDVWNCADTRFWPSGVSSASFFAYAPYDNLNRISYDDNNKLLSFPVAYPADGYFTGYDVLYACHKYVQRGEPVQLHFNHALSKLQWGTFTDNSGTDITITNVALTADLYKNCTVNLADGNAYGTVSGSDLVEQQTVADFYKYESSTATFKPIMIVPQPNLAITFTLTYNTSTQSGQTLIITKTMNCEKGAQYTFNLAIGSNHEVVIN